MRPRPELHHRSGVRSLAVVTMVVVALAVVSGATHPAGASAGRTPLPAGPRPSEIAKMPCQREVQKELAAALGVKARVGNTAWVHHQYSCLYRYGTSAFALSIQELSSWPQTFSYYRGLGKKMGDVRYLANLGQGAFQTTDGSVVVRKDWKVLLVDIAGLPPRFGVPATSVADAAVTIADVILGCWSGD